MSIVSKNLVRVCAVGLALTGAACARYPAAAGPNVGTRMIVSLTVDSSLRTGLEQGGTGLPYVYIVAFRLSEEVSPTSQGPIPVVTPSGNGFVAGNATHFVLWNPLASPAYQLYKFRDASLNEWTLVGTPSNSIPAGVGSRELQFEVDMGQLVPPIDLNRYKSVQINILSMNNTNTAGGGRLWDALGNGNNVTQINKYLTARTTTNRTYNNATELNVEPKDDCPDPSLDLVDWSVEIIAN